MERKIARRGKLLCLSKKQKSNPNLQCFRCRLGKCNKIDKFVADVSDKLKNYD